MERYRHPAHRDGRIRGAAPVVALLLLAFLGSCDDSPIEPGPHEVLLGGLFSLTGNWSTLGVNAEAALELAVDDVNRYLTGNAADLRFVAVTEDTRLDPEVALDKAMSLGRRGAQLLIGPQSSAEVARLRAFVDSAGILLVSPSSTAGSLAIAGDNVFRFTPTDSLEGAAVSALMWDDGIRAVVPVWRADDGNRGLQIATRAQVTALGGTVLPGVEYPADAADFEATVAEIRADVLEAIDLVGDERVAVYLAAFDEVVGLFEAAGDDPVLGSVRWYGSDGVALSAALLGSTAADFAIRVGYPNPLFGLDAGAREIWEPLVERITARTGLVPDAFALAVYDAVWVVARGYVASGATVNAEQLREAFTIAASTHYGATGWTVLNDAGDRRHGDFDFWAIREVDGEKRWVRVAQFETRTGRLVR